MCVAALAIVGPIISAVAGIAGAMVSAAGAQQQAEAESQKAAYEAAVSRNNATAEAYKGTEQAQDTADKGSYALAKQRAAFAASGASVDTGTPVAVLGISAGHIAGDVATDQYNGKIEAQRWQDQATLHDMEVVNAKKKGDIAATSAIIGGVASVGKLFGGGGSGSGQSLTAFG